MGPAFVVAAICAAVAAAGAAPAPAAAESLQKEFSVFSECPVNNAAVVGCLYSTTSAGEFKLGSKTVPVSGQTIVLQGGNVENSPDLVNAANGETVSKTPLTLPGGLTGIELGLSPNEVTATAEQAGTVQVEAEALGPKGGTAVVLPLKIKLTNTALGESCYVGSDAEPVTLHLTIGTTSPPAGTAPITGKKGTLNLYRGAGKIIELSGTELVDNTFPAPGASGCGEPASLLVDPVVDEDSGLPAAAGTNVAILDSHLEVASVGVVRAERTLPELGRCVKAASTKDGKETAYAGLYFNSACTEENPYHDSEYEWEPGTGAASTFTASGKAVSLETVSGTKLKCAESSGSGQYTGTKSATLSLTLSGCENYKTKQACQSTGAASGVIATGPLHANLGFIEDAVHELDFETFSVGWALEGGSTLLSGSCGSGGEAFAVTGSVIGKASPIDKMLPSYGVAYAAKGGIQKPEAFEEQPKQTLSETIGSQGAQTTGLTSSLKIANSEKLEIKAVDE
jgi:hypothetical protein